MWKYIAIVYILANCCQALKLRDIIEPDVIDDFINEVDISNSTDKGDMLIDSKTDNEKDVNVTGHEQVSIAESGMDNTTTSDDDSIKI